jgi:hypothetical protein
MSTAESSWSRRWFPSRLFLPHEQRKTLAFTALQAPATLLGPLLPVLLVLARARLLRGRAPPTPPQPQPGARTPVWQAVLR